MHPIMKGFVDTLQVSHESRSANESLEVIRERPLVVVAVRPDFNGNADLLEALEGACARLPRGKVDVFFTGLGLARDSSWRLSRYFRDRFSSWSVLSHSPNSRGFLFLLGAEELVLGNRAGFLPFRGFCRLDGMEISNDDLDTLGPEQGFAPEKVIGILTAKRIASQKAAFLLQENGREDLVASITSGWLSPLAGCREDLTRDTLKTMGLNVVYPEDLGIQASLNQLEAYYRQLVNLTTVMEGTHQVQVPPGQVPDLRNVMDHPFKAQAKVCAIVETRFRRLLCFHVKGLPPENSEEIGWVEK